MPRLPRPPSRLLLKAAFSAALLYVLFRIVDPASLAGSARDIWWTPVALAVLLNGVLQVLNAAKVRLLLPPPRPPLGGLVGVNLVSLFFSTFVPGGVGGEVARWVYLGKASGSRSRALAAILIDRVTGLWAQVLLALAAWVALRPGGAAPAAAPAALLLLGASLWAGLKGYRAAARLAERAAAWHGRLAGRPPGDGAGISAALEDLLASRGRFLAVASLSLVYQALVAAAFLLLDRALGGTLGWSEALVFLFVHTVVLLLPLTLGSWGLSEGTLAALYHYAGAGAGSGTGLILALLLRGIHLPFALAGWTAWLLGRAGADSRAAPAPPPLA